MRKKDGLTKKRSILGEYAKHKYMMIMFVPVIIYYLIFCYVPISGVIIAFKDYKLGSGMWGGSWSGLKHFKTIFGLPSFWQVFTNTIIMSFYKLLFGFPAPILFAILLNEVRHTIFKKVVQTISYLPHFVSWVVLTGIFVQLLSPSTGALNIIMGTNTHYMASPEWFRTVVVATSVWQSLGWGSIVYFAALTSISPELYEAAIIDGANRFKRIWHITLPSLIPVITIMLIMQIGKLINDDFDQIFNMLSTPVMKVGDVISTYTYQQGIARMNYSFATAVGLFKNIISVALIVIANAFSKRINEYGIW